MPYIPDAYDAYRAYEDRQETELARLPKCCECGYAIQDEKLFLINDCTVCKKCLYENYEKDTEDYES